MSRFEHVSTLDGEGLPGVRFYATAPLLSRVGCNGAFHEAVEYDGVQQELLAVGRDPESPVLDICLYSVPNLVLEFSAPRIRLPNKAFLPVSPREMTTNSIIEAVVASELRRHLLSRVAVTGGRALALTGVFAANHIDQLSPHDEKLVLGGLCTLGTDYLVRNILAMKPRRPAGSTRLS